MILGEQLNVKTNHNYNFYKFPNGTTVSSSSSPSKELTIDTTGNPVLITISGDFNPGSGTDWYTLVLYKDGTALGAQTNEGCGNSLNSPFCYTWLDTPDIGLHTYKVQFVNGSGSGSFTEAGYYESPNFCVFELQGYQ